jgi:hypothetical protein
MVVDVRAYAIEVVKPSYSFRRCEMKTKQNGTVLGDIQMALLSNITFG